MDYGPLGFFRDFKLTQVNMFQMLWMNLQRVFQPFSTLPVFTVLLPGSNQAAPKQRDQRKKAIAQPTSHSLSRST